MPNMRNGDHAGKKAAVDHVVPGHHDGGLATKPEKERERSEPRDRGETEVGRRVRAAVHHSSIVGPASAGGASE
jgi:hypothetical protein